MEGFEWIERIPNVLRWILFIPFVFVVYFVMRLIGTLSIGYAIGPEEGGFIDFLIYTFFYNFMCVGTSLFISCLMVPKGRLVVAFLYLAIILVLSGMGISNLMNGSEYYYPVWRVIYESLCTIGGYIFAFIIVFLHEKELKNKYSVTI